MNNHFRPVSFFLTVLMISAVGHELAGKAFSQSEPKIKVACVGDSITFGAGVKNREQKNYPKQLSQLLGEDYEVRNFGVSGTTLLSQGDHPWIKSRAFQAATDFDPHIVVINLGANDTKPQNFPTHPDTFKADYIALVNHFRKLPNKPLVYLCDPCPVVKDNFTISARVMDEGVRPRIAEVARELGCNIIDLNMPMKGHAAWFPDGVHPNAKGASMMAATVSRQLQSELDPDFDLQEELAKTDLEVGEFSFHGYVELRFELNGVSCRIVKPHVAAKESPWVWRARFYGHQPQFDIAMLQQGWHVCYCEVGGLYGAAPALKRWDDFYQFAQQTGLGPKPFLEGMSRGGLIIHNWAKAYPDQVCGIYGDNAVCDGRSWPGGKGAGKGSEKDWQQLLKVYELTEAEADQFKGFPIDGLEKLAQAGVPILHINGTADDVVPAAENSDLLVEKYKQLGGKTKVILKEGKAHHPHSLKDATPIVEFALESLRR